ncbi:MAG: hypothetical protein AVDCRST_MAG55-2830, partial [uncultured Rubrobacteraceae bacterium]
ATHRPGSADAVGRTREGAECPAAGSGGGRALGRDRARLGPYRVGGASV